MNMSVIFGWSQQPPQQSREQDMLDIQNIS